MLICNFRFYKKHLIPLIPLTEQQFKSINVNDPVEKVATDYEATVREEFGNSSDVPSFDLLLLGIGPDGHTASLFPNHPLLNVANRLISHIVDSPKPPPKRITMTYTLIDNARNSIFTVPGKGKAEILKKIFEDKIDLPAARVQSTNVYWLFDNESAPSIMEI
jgi:6-phosphogluconolactonase